MTKTIRSPLHPETRRSTSARREVRLLGLGLAALVAATGCPDNNPASDARGNYELAYDNQLTVRLKIGGVVREAEANEDDTVTFETDSGPVTIDLNEFCGREDVQCPSEALWTDVSVDQPNIETDNPNTHVINFIDTTPTVTCLRANAPRWFPDLSTSAIVLACSSMPATTRTATAVFSRSPPPAAAFRTRENASKKFRRTPSTRAPMEAR